MPRFSRPTGSSAHLPWAWRRLGGLDIADMLSALGRPGEARQVLEDYVSRSVVPGHADYLATYLEQAGHPDLVDRIRSQPYANPLVE